MHTLMLVMVLSSQELISITIGQAAVQANVFLTLRETPEGNEKLQLLGYRWHHLFNHLKGYVCRHRPGTHLGEGLHTPIWPQHTREVSTIGSKLCLVQYLGTKTLGRGMIWGMLCLTLLSTTPYTTPYTRQHIQTPLTVILKTWDSHL